MGARKTRLFIMALALGTGFYVERANATFSLGSVCPNVFEAVVSNVIPAESPFLNSSTLEKIRVSFQVTNVLKGEVTGHKEMVVLKNGPVRFQTDQVYRVTSSNDLLCHVTKI